jgi:hypothetical protein
MDKNKCPKSISPNILPKKLICHHNLFLWSHSFKKFFRFVTIKFEIFCGNSLGDFLCRIYIGMSYTEKSLKISAKFVCDCCNYKCSKKSEYYKHKILQNPTLKISETKFFKCNCGKIYKHSSTLYAHKKNCNYEDKNAAIEHTDINVINEKNLIMTLINDNKELRNLLLEQYKENTEFKNMMMEQQNIMLKVIENGTHNTTNTHTNSHNKAFNLNFFLNETCKDAMNITDFVNSIQLQLSDLEKVGELGYVEGISNIIMKSLKELDVTQRPVHCTDKKRETMYVKDENTWEKDEERKKMHKLVKKITDKNIKLLPKYRELYPDYINASSLRSDQYNQIFLQALGGSGDNDYEKEEKIIQKVSREVLVEKTL